MNMLRHVQRNLRTICLLNPGVGRRFCSISLARSPQISACVQDASENVGQKPAGFYGEDLQDCISDVKQSPLINQLDVDEGLPVGNGISFPSMKKECDILSTSSSSSTHHYVPCPWNWQGWSKHSMDEQLTLLDISNGRNGKRSEKDPKRGFSRALLSMGAFSIFGLFKKKEELNLPVLTINQARAAHQELKFQEAEDLYHKALQLLIEERKMMVIEEKDFIEKRTVVINGLANLALIDGRLRDAEELFKDCMKGMLMCGMEKTDNALVEISLKLCTVYAHQKRYAEAMAGYKFCVKTQEKKMLEKGHEDLDTDTLALYGLSLDNRARFLIAMKEYTEAEKCLKEALKISDQLAVRGEDVQQTNLVILNNLATLYLHRNEFDWAESYMARAVTVAEKAKLPELAAYYCNLGSVYICKGQLDKACELCEKSKMLSKKKKDKDTESKADLCLQEIANRRNKSKV